MNRSVALLALATALAAVLPFAASRSAYADATIEPSEVENGYPDELIFPLTATSDVEIVDVTLRYTISGTNVGAIGKPEPGEFAPGTAVTTTVKVDANPNTNWIAVGSKITWNWELALADGTTTVGPESTFLYLPPDKEWQTAENDTATLYYTGPREGLVTELLDAIDETHERHGRTLLKTELPPGTKITVVIFGSSNDLQESQPSKGTTLDNSDSIVTCGYRPQNFDYLIVSTASCGGSDPVDTIRHEFAHILNAEAGAGSLVSLPTWLEEGLAVIAQDEASLYVDTFEAAYRRDNLIPFDDMILPVANPDDVILQYGQGFAMTSYLIEIYGIPKLNDLLERTKANTRFDVAFEETYGFDIDGFEEEFLAALGGGAPTPAPTQQERPDQPTMQPTPRDQSQPQPTEPSGQSRQVVADDDDDNFGNVMIAIVGVAVLLMLAAVMSFLLMMFLQNQRRPRV